jgi:hypothetical protein
MRSVLAQLCFAAFTSAANIQVLWFNDTTCQTLPVFKLQNTSSSLPVDMYLWVGEGVDKDCKAPFPDTSFVISWQPKNGNKYRLDSSGGGPTFSFIADDEGSNSFVQFPLTGLRNTCTRLSTACMSVYPDDTETAINVVSYTWGIS